jgi:outer membrane protein TolC
MSRTITVALVLAVLGSAPRAQAQTSETPPIDLKQAIARALERSPEIGIARADADEAHASARLADAAFRPEAYVTTTPGYSSGLPIQVAGQVPSLAGVSLRKTIYDPSQRAEAFESRVHAASLDGVRERSVVETVRAVAAAYGRNWSGETLLADARARLEIREAGLRRVSALRREGRLTDLDVEKASLEVARAKQKLSDEQSERALDQLELKRLLDWPAHETLSLSEDPLAALPKAEGDAVVLARAADPELKALAQETESLRAAASLYDASWRPVVQAEARYLRLASYNNFDQYFVKFKPNDFAIGVSVAIPVWTGGRQAEARAAARARVERLESAQRSREKDVELAARRAEAEALHAEAQAALARRAESVAREDLRVIQALADEGRAEPVDIERRQIAVSAAQDDLAMAEQGLLAARVKLLVSTGQLPGVSRDEPGGATAAVVSVR